MREVMAGFKCPTHDFAHVTRVREIARQILKKDYSNANASMDKISYEKLEEIVDLVALCHDYCDSKMVSEDKTLRVNKFIALIERFYPDKQGEEATLVADCIQSVGYKHLVDTSWTLPPNVANHEYFSKAYLIVQDADLIDAIGAVGVARCFAFSGKRNRALFSPLTGCNFDEPLLNYKNNNSKGSSDVEADAAVGHFFEKLFRIPSMLRTETGRNMAIQRYKHMLDFMTALEIEIGASLSEHDFKKLRCNLKMVVDDFQTI